MQTPDQKNGYDIAQRATVVLRGDVIDLFAQAEFAINAVLSHAAALTEYKALKPAFPHLIGQKIERMRKLRTEAGPLREYANDIAPLVDRLSTFEDLRRFMAHGKAEVALMQSGEPIYVFSLSCSSGEGLACSTLALTRPAAQSRTARLADTVRVLTATLDELMRGTRPATARGQGKADREAIRATS